MSTENNDLGRVADGEQALVNEAATHLHPAGFDPSRELDHGYTVTGEILEYFERYSLATWAPIAAIIRREREAAMLAERERCAALALKWRDENRAAAAKARSRESRLDRLGLEHPGMSDMLEGAATECNAIAAAMHEPASGVG